VLRDVSFEVAAGECVAIVGASGSGKSTLARLMAGLYAPSAGAIAVDGRDLQAWDLHALRERFGIVTQETRLFSATLRDNVALFDPEVPDERIEHACQLACLHDSITQMPMGYDTLLADGGSSLSGGQRQRLSLARALLREPALLILDEATSALDTETERQVQQQLRGLSCTRIVVAHRLSTVSEADKIIVLDAGKVAGIGSHQELLTRCEAYRTLVRAQDGGGFEPAAGAAWQTEPHAHAPRERASTLKSAVAPMPSATPRPASARTLSRVSKTPAPPAPSKTFAKAASTQTAGATALSARLRAIAEARTRTEPPKADPAQPSRASRARSHVA
jgi:ABC-type multidrug transport system ATPase subunit